MNEALWTALTIGAREGLELAFLLALAYSYLEGAKRPDLGKPLFLGALAGILGGAGAGYALVPLEGSSKNIWAFAGLTVHAALYFSSVFFVRSRVLPKSRVFLLVASLSFTLVIFDATGLYWVLKGIGTSAESSVGAILAGTAGLVLFLAPLPFLRSFLARIDWRAFWSPAAFFLTIGTVGLVIGGVTEFSDEDLMISLQRGVGPWLTEWIRHTQNLFLIPEHPYLKPPLEGLMNYLGGDRVAMSLTVTAVCFPPVWILARLAAAPDPEVRHIEVGAKRRMALALFRQDILFRGTPVMLSFVAVVFLIHSANLTLNPLYDPDPVVVSADETGRELLIPLADEAGDYRDGKIRRYLYFYGDRKIVFLAMMKPDGAVAAALDECEICRPAAWNTKAIGYAQRGKNMVCKYCVSPIPVSTFGEPGGCNPIPIRSEFDEEQLIVRVDDLIETWNWAQKLEKAGTHF